MKLLADKTFTVPAETLAELIQDARTRTLEVVSDLPETSYEVPELMEVNPFRWELGHVAFFYEAFLLRVLDDHPEIIPGGNDLFNSFEVEHDDRWGLPLPTVPEAGAYLATTHRASLDRLADHTPTAIETYLYHLAAFHEDMHGEAFCYMRQRLGYTAPKLSGAKPITPAAGPHAGDVSVEGGVFMLGASEDQRFVFDNEKWAHPVEVNPFQIARAPVTQSEFAEFVSDGGYRRRELWSTPGWVWRCKCDFKLPTYWQANGSGWLQRRFDQWVPLSPHAPMVHVSWYEAEAYCRWARRRLPTEAEWDMAASWDEQAGRKRCYPWGDTTGLHGDPHGGRHGNLDGSLGGVVDVAAFPEGDSAAGCRQMLGNVWEWTTSSFYPFPGYIPDYPYREYSAPWFGYRKVLKGGSWATRQRLIHNSYRNYFTPDRCDVIAGFRTCAMSLTSEL